MNEEHRKIRASHLQRSAFLYIRQSSLQQIYSNQESTRRQYALRQRAVALGWKFEDVVVIDNDQGQSGSSTADRKGFQRLVAEVGLGHVGIVLGLEVSRLARNNSDWHRLLEICGMTDTLILDEDGIYDPSQFNDRLLLGLKGAMSEAELHVLRARLRGGILNKARRGELKSPLPVGLVYDPGQRVVLDPDRTVRESVQLLFEIFERTGSASATVRGFKEQKLKFPRRPRHGPKKGEVVWGALGHDRVLQVLHNPRYAGAFVYGRHRLRRRPDGGVSVEKVPRNEWHTVILDAHPGYLSWQQFEANERLLATNAQNHGKDRSRSPPREGPALLQGMVMCGSCGERMTVRYHRRDGKEVPTYVCQRERVERCGQVCQTVPGGSVDRAIGQLVVETLTPESVEVALAVQREVERRVKDVENLHRQHVERARYEAELARRRFMLVDPSNRLVADALEAEWNEKISHEQQAQEECNRQTASLKQDVSDESKKLLMSLTSDFGLIWHSQETHDRDRKRMLRLLVADVTLMKQKLVDVHVRFIGGATHSMALPLPKSAWQQRKTPPEIVSAVDSLLDSDCEAEIAEILNKRGCRLENGRLFTTAAVSRIRRAYGLKSRHDRLRATGLLTQKEIALRLGVAPRTVKMWRKEGLLHAVAFNNKGECLFSEPGPNAPTKQQGLKFSSRTRHRKVGSDSNDEVQYDV